jgi:hypothetical protein
MFAETGKAARIPTLTVVASKTFRANPTRKIRPDKEATSVAKAPSKIGKRRAFFGQIGSQHGSGLVGSPFDGDSLLTSDEAIGHRQDAKRE